jgi:hypothetical protein
MPHSRRPGDRERKPYAYCPLVHKEPSVIEWLGPGDKLNTTYFDDVIIVKLVQALYPGGAGPRQRKFSLQLENALSLNSAGIIEVIDVKNSFNYPACHIRRM